MPSERALVVASSVSRDHRRRGGRPGARRRDGHRRHRRAAALAAGRRGAGAARSDADVTVTRDDRGVPTITATTAHGPVPRPGLRRRAGPLLEIDYRRHVTSGRLSELVGENKDALAADKVIRTFGWRRVAEQEWGLLEQSTRTPCRPTPTASTPTSTGRTRERSRSSTRCSGCALDVQAPQQSDHVDSLAWLKAMACGPARQLTTPSWSAPRRTRRSRTSRAWTSCSRLPAGPQPADPHRGGPAGDARRSNVRRRRPRPRRRRPAGGDGVSGGRARTRCRT